MAFLKEKIPTVFSLLLALSIQNCGIFSEEENPLFRKKYLVMPGAQFVAGKLDKLYPECPNADYPLRCPEKSGCCPEGYPFSCPQLERCYQGAPGGECPGQVYTCTPEPVIISGVSPKNAELYYGQKLNVTVSFKKYEPQDITKLIVETLDGRFEQPVKPEESASGVITTQIVVTEKADLSQCLQECSKTGACPPCFMETNLPIWNLEYLLEDSLGNAYGNLLYLSQISLRIPEQPSGCDDGSSCCTTRPDCGGGIGCQVVGITTPENCDCPPNTTYNTTDIHYHVKICSCNDCQ